MSPFPARLSIGTAAKAIEPVSSEFDTTMPVDATWVRVERMLSGAAIDPGTTAAENRRIVDAVPWRIRKGSPQRGATSRSGGGPRSRWVYGDRFSKLLMWTLQCSAKQKTGGIPNFAETRIAVPPS